MSNLTSKLSGLGFCLALAPDGKYRCARLKPHPAGECVFLIPASAVARSTEAEVLPDVEHLRKLIARAEAADVAVFIEEARDGGNGGSGTLGHTDNQLFAALAALLALAQDCNPCKSCGADPSVYPEPGAELPIVRGALDAQEDAERRLFAERERQVAAVVSAHGHGQESTLRDVIAFLAGSGYAKAAEKVRAEFAGTMGVDRPKLTDWIRTNGGWGRFDEYRNNMVRVFDGPGRVQWNIDIAGEQDDVESAKRAADNAAARWYVLPSIPPSPENT